MPLGPPLDTDPFSGGAARLGPPLDFDPFEQPEGDGFSLGNIGLGIGERAADLGAGLTRSINTVADWLEEQVPLGGVRFGPEGIELFRDATKEPDDENALKRLQRNLEGVDLGYEPGTTWEEVKDSPAANVVPFAIEQGLVSAPDMAAVILNLPGYVAARTGELGQERAEADKRKEATVGDLMAALPGATASAMLERLGARGILGIGDAVRRRSIRSVAGATARGSAREGFTEMGQEGLEYTTERLGTETGWHPHEALDRMLAGGTTGVIFGGSVRAGTASAESLLAREDVDEIANRRSQSLRGERAAAVDNVPPPSPEDEASPIPTRDIVEGRQRIADAQAVEEMNPYLRDQGVPEIGSPARITRGGRSVEGIVTDAWGGADPGIAITTPDGTQTDLSLAALRAQGAQLERLPLPATRQELDAAAEEARKTAEKEREEVRKGLAVSGIEPLSERIGQAKERVAAKQGVDAAQDEELARIERLLDQMEAEDAAREQEARAQGVGQVGAPGDEAGARRAEEAVPTLSREQAAEVARLTREGVPSRDAVRQAMQADIAREEALVEPEPTDAMKEAGNYRKGHVKVQGLDISIENARGSERSGTGRDGKRWSVEMPAAYGYIRRTEGADNDQVDVYLGADPDSDEVFVVDQVDADTGMFDEHKVMIGYRDELEALADYDAAFNDGRGPDRRGAVTPMSMQAFKNWLRGGDTTVPVNRAAGIATQEDGTGPAAPPDAAGVSAEGEGREPDTAPPQPILRATGEPYKTKGAAVIAARSRKIEGDPVEVEGGWGIQERAMAAPSAGEPRVEPPQLPDGREPEPPGRGATARPRPDEAAPPGRGAYMDRGPLEPPGRGGTRDPSPERPEGVGATRRPSPEEAAPPDRGAFMDPGALEPEGRGAMRDVSVERPPGAGATARPSPEERAPPGAGATAEPGPARPPGAGAFQEERGTGIRPPIPPRDEGQDFREWWEGLAPTARKRAALSAGFDTADAEGLATRQGRYVGKTARERIESAFPPAGAFQDAAGTGIRPPAPSAEPDTAAPPPAEASPARPDDPVKLSDQLWEFDPAQLETDARAFQYKAGGDEAGVTERLQGVKRWDQVKAGIAIIYEHMDGRRVVADGHQRLGLAKRLEAQGQQPKIIGQLFREADGYTVEDIREVAALKNMAEGTGTAFDAATVLRDSKDPEAALAELPPRSSLIRNARAISQLEAEAFAIAKAAELPAEHVAVVGRVAAGDGPLQEALIKEFIDRRPPNAGQAEAIARMFAEDRTGNETTEDLFGGQEIATSFYRERARIIDGAIRRLKQDKRVFSTLDRHAKQIEAEGNVLVDANLQVAERADKAAYLVQQLATRAGPVSDAVKAAARRVSEGVPYTEAINDVTAAVQEWAATGGGPLGDAGGARRETDAARRDAGEAGREGAAPARDADEDVDAEPTAAELEAAGQSTMFQRDRRDTGTFDMFAVPTATAKPPPEPSKPAPTGDGSLELFTEKPAPKPERIEDFGEKIAGARKDLAQQAREAITRAADIDIAVAPLSESFPQLNYPKLAAEGKIDRDRLAFYAIVRAAAPNKPRVRYKLRRWVDQVNSLRDFATKVMDETFTMDQVRDQGGRKFADSAEMIGGLEPELWVKAAGRYQLRQGKFHRLGDQYFGDAGKEMYYLSNRGRIIAEVASEDRAEAIRASQDVMRRELADAAGKPKSQYTKLKVYRTRAGGDIYIAFKLRGIREPQRLKAGFASAREAFAYITEHRDELQAKVDEMRKAPEMRQAENRPRVGPAHHDADVTPEQFSDMFGFRGVQFGNYVEGPRRQEDLNRAYDALMDMADAIGVPPKALALDGTLGLAFGARGRGGNAAAHYEPTQVVINLTKTQGPGSLAHEWLHALDNNFGTRGGRDYATEAGTTLSPDVRRAVAEAWGGVVTAINRSEFSKRARRFDAARSKDYWSKTIEKAARAFERFVFDQLQEQGFENDYLVNINRKDGAYPTEEEMRADGIAEAFGKLFDVLEHRTTDRGVQLYRRTDAAPVPRETEERVTDDRVRIRVKRRFDKKAQRIQRELNRVARQAFGDQFNVELAESIAPPTGGHATGAFDPTNRIAYIALRADEPGMQGSLWHEGLHYLRSAGAFTRRDGEPNAAWRTLEKEAPKWRKTYGIDDRYARDVRAMDPARREDLLNEEAIAEALADYQTRGQDAGFGPTVRAALNRIMRFFRAMAAALKGRGFKTWEDVFEQDIAGGEAAARTGQASREALDRYLQTAWHGSPHEFGRFSTEAIGSGEGAQAYGWGLYFADKRGVADWYRKNLASASPRLVHADGRQFDSLLLDPAAYGEIEYALRRELNRVRGSQEQPSPQQVAMKLREEAHREQIETESGDPQYISDLANIADGLMSGTLNVRWIAGATYRVDLAPKDDEYLRWDRPFSRQSDKVKATLEKARGEFFGHLKDDTPGSQIYQMLAQRRRGGAGASKWLLDRGIRGIKYRDAMSRGDAGEASHNYVIFDDSDVAIEEIMLQRGEGEAQGQLGMFASEIDERGDEQAVIPGAERITDRELAERRMREPMRGRVPQAPMNEGLFDSGAGKQIDLEEAIANTESGTLFQRPSVFTGIGARRQLASASQEAAIEQAIGNGDRSPYQRLKEWIAEGTARRGLYLRQALIDTQAPQERLEKERFGGLLSAERSPTKAAAMTRNLQSVMAVLLRHGMIKLDRDAQGNVTWFKNDESWTEGGLESIFEPLAERGLLQQWQGWAYANRAQRLIKEGKEKNLTEAQIDDLLQLGEQHPEFKEAMAKWTRFNNAILDLAEGAGLINAEQRAAWQKDDYVPFYRVTDEAVKGAGGQGTSGLFGQRSGIRQLKGSELKSNEILENMVMNVASLVDRSFKNVAARKSWAMMMDAGIISEPEMGWRQVTVSAAEAARQLGKAGINVETLTPQQREEALKFYQMQNPPHPQAVSVMIDGKPVWGIVEDGLMYNAVTGLEPNTLPGIFKLFRMAKRTLTTGVTADPGFMLANAARDTLSAWTSTGQSGFKPIIDTAKGFKKALANDPSLLAIMASGGGSGGFYRTEPDEVRRQLNAKLRGINRDTVLDTPSKLWKAWTKVGAASEAASRIGVFEAAKKEGLSDTEAAYRALDVLDFSRHGSSKTLRFFIEAVPFMNARIQGLDRLYRGAKDNPKRFLLRGSLIMAASLALEVANMGDDRYEDLEEWDKDTYFHFWLGEDHYRLPKPFEVGVIFATLPARALRLMVGSDRFDQSANSLKRAILDTFAMDPTPQMIKPIYEQMENRTRFTGRPIVNMSLQKLMPEAQTTARTSETARLVGEMTGMSPVRLDHLVRGYLGTLGTYALAASDVLARAMGDEPVLPEKRIDEIPVIGRFKRDDPARTSRFVTEFYDMRNETQEIVNTIRHYRKADRTVAARKLQRQHPGVVAKGKRLNRTVRTLSDIRRQEQNVRRSRDLSAAEKRRRLDQLTTRRLKLTKRTVERERR